MIMFERCSDETMRIVDAAVSAARGLGHNYLGTEHLLLAFADRSNVLPASVATRLPGVEVIRSGIAGLIGEPVRRDAELLRSIGVDLEEIRAAVRLTFGDQAIDQLRRSVHQPWQPWRRPSRRCTSLLAGTMTVAAGFKEAFERAASEANRRGMSSIEPTVLLLGIVEVEDSLANRLLRDNGIDPTEIRGLLVADHR